MAWIVFAALARVAFAAGRAGAGAITIVHAWRAHAVAKVIRRAAVARRRLARRSSVTSVALALALPVAVDQLPGTNRVAQRVWVFDAVARFNVAKVTCKATLAIASAGVTFRHRRACLVAPGFLVLACARRGLARLAPVPSIAFASRKSRGKGGRVFT